MRGLGLVSFNIQELEELKAKIRGALSSGHIGAWETKFLSDMKARIDRYGRDVRLSDKQLAKLDEILGRSAPRPGNSERANVFPYYSPQRTRTYRPYRRYPLGGSMSTKLMAFVVLAVVVAVSSIWQKGGSSFDGRGLISQPSSPQTEQAPKFTQSNITRSDFSVTDGDTIRINGERKGMRLVGFNTPETVEPRCERERALGQKAKARLRQLVSKGRLIVERVRCACQPGSEGTEACNHGRSCGSLSVDGRNVGDILIDEGLAVPFVCGSRSCPPTPRPWCA
jgi:micrococcal nuclease